MCANSKNVDGPPEIKRVPPIITALIVDDCEAVRSSLTGLLETFPRVRVVGTAENGTEALEIIIKKRPRLALIDFLMPGLDGMQVTREIRKRNSSIRVIIMTVCDAAQVKACCLSGGADAFLSKQELCRDLEKTISSLFPSSLR